MRTKRSAGCGRNNSGRKINNAMAFWLPQRILRDIREFEAKEAQTLSYHTNRALRFIFSKRLIAKAAGLGIAAGAIAVLLGWGLGIGGLKALALGGTAIKINAAVGFALAAIALLILQADRPRRALVWVARCIAALVILLGIVTMFQYAAGADLGIDNLLLTEMPGAPGTSHPGRMSLQEALVFVMTGTALFLLSRERSFGAIHFFAILTGFFGLAAFVGYAYRSPLFYAFGPFSRVPFTAAFFMMFMGAGILFARPHRGFAAIITSDSAGGNMARRLLPAAILIPLLVGVFHRSTDVLADVNLALELALQCILSIVLLVAVIWENARSLHRIDRRRQRAEEEIRHQALHDSLTGLPNRDAVRERFAALTHLARAEHSGIALIFVDLDRFKTINDTLGHSIGDEILKEVAARFQAALRADEMICRLGGDEFLVVASGIRRADDAKRIAEKILRVLDQPLIIREHRLHIGASIGIALFPRDGNDIHALLRHADTALYRAKETGRNRYQFYEQSMNVASYAKLSLENDLRSALAHREFALSYQPIADMRERVIGVEALLRWHHPKIGPLDPSEFILLAEETGLIVPIGEWVMRTAARAWRAWRANDAVRAQLSRAKIAVNVSSRQFSDPGLAEALRRIGAETGVNLRDLEFEITESVAMERTEHTLRKIKEFQEMGIALAIDDFGTGYSSLSYLKRFPVAHLKIDKSFVAHCDSDEYDASIVRAIVAMGHGLDIAVIAEGVENAAQMKFLKSAGCDGAQGYLIGAPMPESQFVEYLAARRP